MDIEDRQSFIADLAMRRRARPEPVEAAPAEAAAAQADPQLLAKVGELIRGVLATPARDTHPEVVALLRGAKKMHKNFQIALALRALHLEQGLRAAQQEVIRLQWELAHLRPRTASPLSTVGDDH